MKEFVFLFRNEYTPELFPSVEQMQATMKKWMEWMGGIAAQNKLVSYGNRLGNGGKVVKPGKVVTDGPYVEMKESIGGFIIIRAIDINEAAEIAKGCPIFEFGGNVEVRDIVSMDM